MKSGRGSIRALARFALGTVTVLAVVATGNSGAQASPSQLPIVVGSTPPGCKRLEDVRGRDQGRDPSAEAAQNDALKEAAKLGATHVKTVWSGRAGAYTEAYRGAAYRCPAPAAPSEGK